MCGTAKTAPRPMKRWRLRRQTANAPPGIKIELRTGKTQKAPGDEKVPAYQKRRSPRFASKRGAKEEKYPAKDWATSHQRCYRSNQKGSMKKRRSACSQNHHQQKRNPRRKKGALKKPAKTSSSFRRNKTRMKSAGKGEVESPPRTENPVEGGNRGRSHEQERATKTKGCIMSGAKEKLRDGSRGRGK